MVGVYVVSRWGRTGGCCLRVRTMGVRGYVLLSGWGACGGAGMGGCLGCLLVVAYVGEGSPSSLREGGKRIWWWEG